MLTTQHLEGAFTVFIFGLVIGLSAFCLEVISQWKYVLQLKNYLTTTFYKLFKIKQTKKTANQVFVAPAGIQKKVTFQVKPPKRNYARMLKRRHYL